MGKNFSKNVLEMLKVLKDSFGSADFIPAMSHAAAKLFNARWRPGLEEASKTKSYAKSNRLILHLPIVTHFSVRLSFSIQFIKIMKRRGEKLTLP